MKQQKLVFLILTLLTYITMFSQIKHIGLPHIKNYEKSSYIGAPQNWGIDQDNKQNIYIANNNGLIKFNGAFWETFNIPNKKLRSLNIAKEEEKIYVGGYDEFGYFEPNNHGKLEYRSLSDSIKNTALKKIGMVWKTHIFNNEIIFQTFNGLYIYKNQSVNYIEAPNRFQFSFLVAGKLYIQDIETGLFEYKNHKLEKIPDTEELNHSEIWGIEKLNDQLLIMTLDKGLFIYKSGVLKPWETEANTFIKKNNSLGGCIVKDKYVVLNSVINGIIIVDFNGNIIQHINQEKGLQNNTVLTSFTDQKDNLWLGLDNGISFIDENSPLTYFDDSFNINSTYALALNKNKLYVATNQGLYTHDWDIPFKETNFELVEGTIGQNWKVQQIDNQIFCSHNRGAFIIENNTIKKTLDTGKGYFNFKRIPDSPNYILASNYYGLALLKKEHNEWNYVKQLSGIYEIITNFHIDGRNIWYQLDNIVYKLRLSDDFENILSKEKFTRINEEYGSIQSVQTINGTIYFQTDNHFFTYSVSKNTFIESTWPTTLFKDIPKIRYCYEDEIGNICYFFEGTLGILRKNKDDTYKNIVTPFATLTSDMVFFYESVNSIDPNNTFIGLSEGMAHVNLESIDDEKENNLKGYIQSFSFGKDTIYPTFSSKRNYDISYNNNHTKFTFSSPYYENADNIQYSYQLEGFDEDWSKWTILPIKEYTNLHEGGYTMKVKARNSFGEISETDTINFVIKPPLYKHPLAYLFYIVSISLTVYFMVMRVKTKNRKALYIEKIEQERQYLEREAKIKQEQYELEKEIERLNNNKLKMAILAKDKELVNNSLQVAKKNKILNGIISSLKKIDVDSMDEETKKQITKLNRSISKEIKTDNSWKSLEKHIKNVHIDFIKRLKEQHPNISPRELDLSTFLLMNMSTKEIAEIMNISAGGVELARYRLRKKLNLNRKDNLVSYLLKI